MPRIWDIHVHFPRGGPQQQNRAAQEQSPGGPPGPPPDPAVAVDHLAEKLREVGTVKASLLCGGRFGLTHEQSIELARRHEDLFVPHAVVDPEETAYERIHQLHKLGYRGLKIIGTRREYDNRDYHPVYRAAEELDMPILFHCGVIGGGIDLLARHPRRDPDSARRMREMDAAVTRQREEREKLRQEWHPLEPPPDTSPIARFRGGRETSALNMRPFHLESIANRFPRLKIIGAHLGGTGNYDEAASVARWRRWVYFDLSGGRTIERHAVERGLIGKEIAIEKLIFGSDCASDEIHEHVERFNEVFDRLGLSEEEKDCIWYRNAAELFGLEEPSWASE
jgi:uncharacterized protein